MGNATDDLVHGGSERHWAHAPGSPSKVEDKRVAIDLAIIRQAMQRTGMSARWCPTELMAADALTKDAADPADLLRTMLSHGSYQLSSEAQVLALKKEQRERRSAHQHQSKQPVVNPSETLICQTLKSYNARVWTQPNHSVGIPLRRISRDLPTGRVLENTDLTRTSPDAVEKPATRAQCLVTEIWYASHAQCQA